MKKRVILQILVALIFVTSVIFLFCPTFVYAALEQSTTASSYIKVESIDSFWCEKNGNQLTQIKLPEYVAAGEKIVLNDAIYTKNIGMPAYARFKIESFVNNQVNECFSYIINQDWVKGNDEYYYFCNSFQRCIIPTNKLTKVVEELFVSNKFTNNDKNTNITIILTLEVIDASSNEYISGWQNNPPQIWFDNI